ncbi:hypothetical protein ACFQ1L_32025 [Phytohabitans flavus]|uniref:hypothetical protein n=1 Tax=Phytohabitans flavus TaxID=1076124 RepID=UPI003644DCA8
MTRRATARFCSAAEAAALIPDGATVLVDGSGGGVNEASALLAAVEARFLAEHAPRDLTLVHVAGMGDGAGGGIDRFAHRGLVRRVIGGTGDGHRACRRWRRARRSRRTAFPRARCRSCCARSPDTAPACSPT